MKRGKMGVKANNKICAFSISVLIIILSSLLLVQISYALCRDGDCGPDDEPIPPQPTPQPTPPPSEIPPTSGRSINVRVDLGDPDELHAFQFGENGNFCNIETIEDDFFNDDKCSAKGKTGAIIKTNGRLYDAIEFEWGGCEEEARIVMRKNFGSDTKIDCGNRCSLSGGGYSPRGEIICGSTGRWYLCDSGFHNKIFATNNKNYKCTTGNEWQEVTAPTPPPPPPSGDTVDITISGTPKVYVPQGTTRDFTIIGGNSPYARVEGPCDGQFAKCDVLQDSAGKWVFRVEGIRDTKTSPTGAGVTWTFIQDSSTPTAIKKGVDVNITSPGGLTASQNPISLNTGITSQPITITDGTSPYKVESITPPSGIATTNPAVGQTFAQSFTVTGAAQGTAKIIVKESSGTKSVEITVNVGTGSGGTYPCTIADAPYKDKMAGFDFGKITDAPTTIKYKSARIFICHDPTDFTDFPRVIDDINRAFPDLRARRAPRPGNPDGSGLSNDFIIFDGDGGLGVDTIQNAGQLGAPSPIALWQWLIPTPSPCGNGVIDAGEDCEPGPPMKFKTGVTDCKTVPGQAFTGGKLECHSSGDDACTYDTSGCTGGTIQPPTTNCNDPSGTRPAITFVSPATAKIGDTLSITGSDLTRTVQFYPAAGAASTYTGMVSSDCGMTTIQVPGTLPIGKYSVKVYKARDKISGGFEVTINGNVPKCSPDGSVCGYCSDNAQCLINPLSTTNPCINSGEYSGDNYCENGEWSSRTKLLALKLLSMKSGDYVLFCDDRENSLNNLQYITESNEVVANVLTNLKTNNFCVLKTGNSVIAATSTDKGYEEVPGGLNIFGVISCTSATNNGQYAPCSSSNKVWYNKKLKSYIYSVTPITVSGNEISFADFIKNPISAIIEAIKRLIIPSDQASLKAMKRFDRLYMAQYSTQQGTRSVIGSIEGKNPSSAVIEYSGFTDDICKFVEEFGKTKAPDLSKISCKKENNKYYAFVQGSEFTNINPEPIWPDLTSKLRLK